MYSGDGKEDWKYIVQTYECLFENNLFLTEPNTNYIIQSGGVGVGTF